MLIHDSSIIQIVWFHKKIDTISKFISNKKNIFSESFRLRPSHKPLGLIIQNNTK